MPSVTIDPRFNGPPHSANGGYACGFIARAVGTQTIVSLRVPPPLGRTMTLDVEDGTAHLRDGGVLVGEARPYGGGWPTVPVSVTLDQAASAQQRYAGFDRHVFPTCWVCGPQRPDGDGLAIFPGEVEDAATEGLVAAPWTQQTDVDSGDGTVMAEHVWAALDCPTYFGAVRDEPAVLASLAADLRAPVRVGRPHVVQAWTARQPDGRKRHGASAVLDADGQVLAVATALWVVLSEEALQAMLARS